MSTHAPAVGLWCSEADLTARLAELAKTGLPLPEGLEALAEEVPVRLRNPLRRLAERLRRGAPVGEALRGLAALPEPLAVMLQSGIAQGRLPEVLEQYARLEGIQAELHRRIRMGLAYPTLLMALLTALSFFLHYFVTLQYEAIFLDFQIKLPDITLFVLAASPWVPWIFAGVTLLLILIPLAMSGMLLVRHVASVIYRLPVFGPLLTTLKMAQLTHWMKMYLTGEVPLPQAFRLTADALYDGHYARKCRQIADEVEQGRELSLAVWTRLPSTLAPLLHWGEQANALPEAFDAAAEMYENRAQIRSTLVESVLSPLFLILFLVFVAGWIIGMFLPFISLITSLSG